MKPWSKFAVALLIAVMANAPLYASCGPSQCANSLCAAELLSDEYFNDGCAWVYTNNSSREFVNGGWVAQLDGSGSVYQDVVVPSGYQNRTMTMTFWLNKANQSSGTEKVFVTVYDGNNIGHPVMTITPSTPVGKYNFELPNFSLPDDDQTISLRFAYVRGSNFQGTVFYIESAHMWIMNF